MQRMEKIKRRVEGQVIEIFQEDSIVKIQVLKDESNKSNEVGCEIDQLRVL